MYQHTPAETKGLSTDVKRSHWKKLSLLALASASPIAQVAAQVSAQDLKYSLSPNERSKPFNQTWSIHTKGQIQGSLDLNFADDIPWLTQISAYAHPNPERTFIEKLNAIQENYHEPIFGFPNQYCELSFDAPSSFGGYTELYTIRLEGLTAAIPELCPQIGDLFGEPFTEVVLYHFELDNAYWHYHLMGLLTGSLTVAALGTFGWLVQNHKNTDKTGFNAKPKARAQPTYSRSRDDEAGQGFIGLNSPDESLRLAQTTTSSVLLKQFERPLKKKSINKAPTRPSDETASPQHAQQLIARFGGHALCE